MNWVGVLLLIIHVLACFGVIFIVLLQAGKGASLGAAFGGGASQTVFGARSATFIGRFTWVLAAVFMLTSLLLTMVSPWGKTGVEAGSTILHEEPVATPPLGEATQPALPELPGAMPPAENIPGTAGETQQGQPAQQPIAPAESHAQPGPEPPHPTPETQTQP